MKAPFIATVLVAVATASLCSSKPAEAQDLGGMLGRLAERAGRNAVDDLTRPRNSNDRRAPAAPANGQPASGSAQATGGGVIPAPTGVEPWPINAGDRAVARPTQFVFSPEVMAQKQAYRDASVYSCTACEAGRDIDSWRKALSPSQDRYSAWSEVFAGWTVGRTIEWRGRALDGRITVLSEVPVGAFNCRQLRYRISTRGPNPVVTESPGLICYGRQNAYSGADLWHEVL